MFLRFAKLHKNVKIYTKKIKNANKTYKKVHCSSFLQNFCQFVPSLFFVQGPGYHWNYDQLTDALQLGKFWRFHIFTFQEIFDFECKQY